MPQYKVLITGPVGAGKTTAICSASDIEPIVTDAISTDESKKKSGKSTVAMDYGVISMEAWQKIHLYGTPGQERFNFMWDVLSAKKGIGLILLLDNSRPDPLHDMRYYLNAFSQYISATHIVIGVTQMDIKDDVTIEDYQQHLNKSQFKSAIFPVDARVKKDIVMLIQVLLALQNEEEFSDTRLNTI